MEYQKRPYWFTIDFTNNIAYQTGTDTQNPSLDNQGDMVVQRILGEFWIAAAVSSAVQGTPLPRLADPSSASNQLPNLSQLDMQITTTDRQWFSNPVRLSVIIGTAIDNNFLLVAPRIAQGQQVSVVVRNKSQVNVNVQGQIVLAGYRLPRDAA